MGITISKEAYEELLKKDFEFLKKHCPNTLELEHIKTIMRGSVRHYYGSEADDPELLCPDGCKPVHNRINE